MSYTELLTRRFKGCRNEKSISFRHSIAPLNWRLNRSVGTSQHYITGPQFRRLDRFGFGTQLHPVQRPDAWGNRHVKCHQYVNRRLCLLGDSRRPSCWYRHAERQWHLPRDSRRIFSKAARLRLSVGCEIFIWLFWSKIIYYQKQILINFYIFNK